MQCELYQNERCYSCQWLSKEYSQQIHDKQALLQKLLANYDVAEFLPPVESQTHAFRNKAKMVVSGSVERPVLGAVSQGVAADLCHCPLYPDTFLPVFEVVKTFMQRAGLTPYHVQNQRGELKYLLLTESQLNRKMMLRFVLRSENKVIKIKEQLPWLQHQLPQLEVISVNIQPAHMAVIEGEKEIILTPATMLSESFNQIPLFIRPGGFFQTNPKVAEQLYAAAKAWLDPLAVTHLWDLFCGVGGFGLHCVKQGMRLTGIEISPEAIACAKQSAEQLQLKNVSFQALDSTVVSWDTGDKPELVIVNPPRRGMGHHLSDYLAQMAPDYLLYSSCNANSMVEDLKRFPAYHIERVQLFDLFPHTAHYEVLMLLKHQKQKED